jgi:hypothetical protein
MEALVLFSSIAIVGTIVFAILLWRKFHTK